MQLLSGLSFQNKIILVTFVMVLLVVVGGAITINRMVLPAMARDIQDETWRIATGLADQVEQVLQSRPRMPLETELENRLSLIFQIRKKLLYVELLGESGKTLLWMGDPKYRGTIAGDPLERRDGSTLYVKHFSDRHFVYEVILPDNGANQQTVSSIRVGVSAESLQYLSRQLFRALFMGTLFILVVSFFLIHWFSEMITRPVGQLIEMTSLLAEGELEDVIKGGKKVPLCFRKVQQSTAEFSLRGKIPSSCPALGPSGYRGLSADMRRQLSKECAGCEVLNFSSQDELSRLLLAFQFMAVRLKAYQEELRQRYEFEERLLDACPDGIMANDREGRIILYNRGAQRLIGYEPEEVLNTLSVQQLYRPGEPQKIKKSLLIDDYGGPGVLLDYTTELIRKDGSHIPIRLSATILYEGDRETAVVGYFHDLTELNEHMHALVETNDRLNKANRQLARLNHRYLEMLGFVTHELKSPIANSYMSANALRQEIFGSLAPEQSIMVEAICRNLDQSMEMIRHYLDLSRIEKDEMTVNPQPTLILKEVIEPVVKGLTSAVMERGVALTIEVPPDLGWTLDPELFRGVVTNLLNNALKYGEKSGKIRLSVVDQGDRMRLEVWNSGPGIREEDQAKLFQKFQRLQASRQSSVRGTGLGLFITKTIVERHGGKIWVESREGEWADFIIELPRK